MDTGKMKKWEAALLIALCLTLCLGVRAQAQLTRLTQNVVRLHVVAVSDSAQEQALKERVRDAVCAYLEPRLAQCSSAEAARTLLAESGEEIRQTALQASEGREVRVSFAPENFPAREGDGVSLPAGRYDTLRVVLGEGKGHNWWGIIFPFLTTEYAAQSAEAATLLGEEGVRLISGGEETRVVRFKLLEYLELLRGLFD